MMPNVPQYPVAVAAILRAGYVVVNVNPLYTPRELEHQLKDSGSKAIVIIENFANTLQQCIANTPVKHAVLASMGDMLGLLKGALVNYVVRNVKKMVPAATCRRREVQGRHRSRHGGTLRKPEIKPDDVAALQYTGGTTGVSKGAVLLHRNVITNVLQSEAWNQPMMGKVPASEQPTSVWAPCRCTSHLRRHGRHDVHPRTGGKVILIPNPRDLPAVLKELSKQKSPQLPRVTRCSTAWPTIPDFDKVDWSHLKVSVAAAWRCRCRGQAVAGEDRLPDLRGLWPRRRPRPRPAATRSPAPSSPAPSACRCPRRS